MFLLSEKIFPTATRIIQYKSNSSVRHLETDICIVGAGISGVAAAVEAARLGKKVTLIDSLPTLGGQAVNSVIGIFCGLFSNSKEPYQFTHGIADDILEELGKLGALNYRYGPNNVVMYDEVALLRTIEKLIRKENINVILGGVLRHVTNDGRRLSSVDVATRFGDLKIIANAFIDTSGDATLAWQAGLPCREPADGTVYGTQMIVLENVNTDNIPDRYELIDRLKIKVKDYGLVREDGFAFAFPSKGLALVNMTHVETPLDPIQITANSLDGKAQAEAAFAFLKSEYPECFANSSIRTYGQLGIRQTRWIVGKHHLTVEEVRNGVKFADAIGRTAWPLELHHRKEGYIWEQYDEDHVHYIPFGSQTPPDADNLVVAGRCIDGDLSALSSVRVMGPCIAMGMAAAHALDLAGTGSVHDIDMEKLQERLQKNITGKDTSRNGKQTMLHNN